MVSPGFPLIEGKSQEAELATRRLTGEVYQLRLLLIHRETVFAQPPLQCLVYAPGITFVTKQITIPSPYFFD
jgi:hypothetical protein